MGLLHARGYLDRDFSEPCLTADPDQHYTRDLNHEVRTLLQDPDPSGRKLWPLQPETWDTDIFYGLIEVFHDLVARPRSRWEHDHGDCGRRPHRGRGLEPPVPDHPLPDLTTDRVVRQRVLGGLINEYERAA